MKKYKIILFLFLTISNMSVAQKKLISKKDILGNIDIETLDNKATNNTVSISSIVRKKLTNFILSDKMAIACFVCSALLLARSTSLPFLKIEAKS